MLPAASGAAAASAAASAGAAEPDAGVVEDAGDEEPLPEEPLPELPQTSYPPHVVQIVERIELAVRCIDGASVRAFGSAVNGFGDAASDVDVVLAAKKRAALQGLGITGKVSNRDLAPRCLLALQSHLREQGFRITERVMHAKVPILKMKFKNQECDLSMNNLLPVFNSRLLKAYADIDGRVVEITRIVKSWARRHEIHGAQYGHLSSYSFSLMVIFYMQVRGALPCLQRIGEEHPSLYVEHDKSFNVAMDVEPAKFAVGEHRRIDFQDMLRFYVHEFKWGESVVSVRRGECLEVSEFPDLKMRPRHNIADAEWRQTIHIEDPFDICRNLNCVLGPRKSELLWNTMAHELKIMDFVEAEDDFPPLPGAADAAAASAAPKPADRERGAGSRRGRKPDPWKRGLEDRPVGAPLGGAPVFAPTPRLNTLAPTGEQFAKQGWQ